MKIPARLKDRLNQNLQLAGAVTLASQAFLKSLSNPQQLFFFPEYTDHGCDHMEGILASIDELITPDSYDLLTSEDAGVLILAVLLHDIAMHLHADSFLTLIKENERPLVPELDDKSWKEEFETYFSHAQRWDERKLYRILGDQQEPGLTQDTIEVVRLHPTKKDPDQWTTKYRKFLGEFIRQKHARLAHEVALVGKGSSVVLKQCGVPSDLIDLAGLIARSHHLPLRSIFSYLTDKYGSRITCQNTHPIYLMTLLRIADYLQLQNTRANLGFLGVQRLRSPLSQEEWNLHLVIKSIQKDDHDQECLYIHAQPESGPLYTKLQKLLEGLQIELDTSWAILGEVYSKERDLKKLGLMIRRVRTNLSNPAEFLKRQKPSFYPMHSAFNTTGAAMLKLLIRPLYGDRPEVGVRELLQNSLDAVRELDQVLADNPDYRTLPRLNQSSDIQIRLLKNNGVDWLIVSDRGIGMTAEVVKDFYLKAGASFRQSDAWWSNFVSKGKSKILRSGRFGIGALAAFLLGNRVQVLTRNLKSLPEEGVSFDASIDDEAIELKRVNLPEVGTTIKIRLTADAAKSLRKSPRSWDWYVLKTPSVERYIDKKKLKRLCSFPNWDKLSGKDDWQVMTPKGLEAVQWTYLKEKGLDEDETFACNGIKIAQWDNTNYNYEEVRDRAYPYYDLIKLPALLIYDPDANLCLNLQRSTVESEVSFANKLMSDIYGEFIAFLMVHGPQSFSEVSGFANIRSLPISIGNVWGDDLDYQHFPLFTHELGFGVATPYILESTGLSKVIKYLLANRNQFIKNSFASTAIEIFARIPSSSLYNLPNFIWFHDYTSNGSKIQKHSAIIVLQPDHSKDIARTLENFEEDSEGFNKTTLPHSLPIYTSKSFDLTKSLLRQIEIQIEQSTEENVVAVCEIDFDWKELRFSKTTFDQVWEKHCPSPIIPFDPQERRRIFASTFQSLKDYIKTWESSRLTGWRKSLVKEVRQKNK